MSVISIDGITKRYGSHVAVDDLNINLSQGEIFGFLGPNGAGKTTAIRVLLGFLRTNSGRAQVLGRDVWRERHHIHKDVGYIAGDYRMYRWMTLGSALNIFGKMRTRDLTKTGLELAERFSLDPQVPVRSMSRGMRQKVGLILALAHEPKVMILDEPTTALDPPMKKTLFAYLRERVDIGSTVFFSSHSLNEVENLCHSVAFLRAGKLVEHESLDVLRTRAHKHVTIKFKEGEMISVSNSPSCIQNIEVQGNTWNGVLSDDIRAFTTWCVGKPVVDLSISPPDLDRLFHTYYSASEVNA